MNARIDHIKGFLLDMDGTLLLGEHILPGALHLLRGIRARHAPLLVLTNNSSEQKQTFIDRLANAGLEVANDEVLTSGDAAIEFLTARGSQGPLFILGTPALRSAFSAAGFDLAEVGEPADTVVLGFDKSLCYERLSHACLLLAEGADYVSTHPDNTCITPEGLIPDAGAIAAAIAATTGRWPTVVGKPEPTMVEAALRRLGCSREETLLVGDQLDTDITMGVRAGIYVVLTLTGETDRRRLSASELQPDAVVENVGELARLLY